MKEVEEVMLCAHCDTNAITSDADWSHCMSSMNKSDPKGGMMVPGYNGANRFKNRGDNHVH